MPGEGFFDYARSLQRQRLLRESASGQRDPLARLLPEGAEMPEEEAAWLAAVYRLIAANLTRCGFSILISDRAKALDRAQVGALFALQRRLEAPDLRAVQEHWRLRPELLDVLDLSVVPSVAAIERAWLCVLELHFDAGN